MIDKATLRAFGFRKVTKRFCRENDLLSSNLPRESYYHVKLDMFYDPTIHSNKQFAQNYTDAVRFKMKNSIKDQVDKAFCDELDTH
jgi:hypothetical protein